MPRVMSLQNAELMPADRDTDVVIRPGLGRDTVDKRVAATESHGSEGVCITWVVKLMTFDSTESACKPRVAWSGPQSVQMGNPTCALSSRAHLVFGLTAVHVEFHTRWRRDWRYLRNDVRLHEPSVVGLGLPYLGYAPTAPSWASDVCNKALCDSCLANAKFLRAWRRIAPASRPQTPSECRTACVSPMLLILAVAAHGVAVTI